MRPSEREFFYGLASIFSMIKQMGTDIAVVKSTTQPFSIYVKLSYKLTNEYIQDQHNLSNEYSKKESWE